METGLPGRRSGRRSGTLERDLDYVGWVGLNEENVRMEASRVTLVWPWKIGRIEWIGRQAKWRERQEVDVEGLGLVCQWMMMKVDDVEELLLIHASNTRNESAKTGSPGKCTLLYDSREPYHVHQCPVQSSPVQSNHLAALLPLPLFCPVETELKPKPVQTGSIC